MTQWTTHIPKRDGDAPEGVTLETHFVQYRDTTVTSAWFDMADWQEWDANLEYQFLPRNPPATYEQVVAWCKANGRDVPAPPIDYEAWGPVMEQYGWRGAFYSQNDIDRLIAAFKLAMTIPACREVIEG